MDRFERMDENELRLELKCQEAKALARREGNRITLAVMGLAVLFYALAWVLDVGPFS